MAATLFSGTGAQAHALDPGYLEIRPDPAGQWRITWRIPQIKGSPMAIEAVLPEGCEPRRPPPAQFDGNAFVTGWLASCEKGMTASPVLIEGLEKTQTDVLIRFVPEPGASATSIRVTADAPSAILPAVPSGWMVLTSYFTLGLDHIAGGVDHLLFVLALLLLVPSLRQLILAITSFTVAHSITLAASTMGWISLPMPPVEAVIALSIVFLASEIIKRDPQSPRFSERNPWIVAFVFGLLHGMGFASALREIGVPEGDIALALLAFNLGVEAGQLLFVAVVVAIGACLTVIVPKAVERFRQPHSMTNALVAYGIGSVAAFWTIERIIGFTG
ncbi:MAG: HupE/UreJ family protein [Paracoccaceae bacterium]